jgi:hypothetical protein
MLPPKPQQRLEPMNDYEQNVLLNVEKYGWHCTSVSPGEGQPDSSPFSYTVGLYQTYGASELVMFGLPGETAHSILSIYANRLEEGRPISLEQPSHDLINDYPCVFVQVPNERYNDYVYSALWFYAEVPFPLHQVVWPNRQGQFPWHPQASLAFQQEQPVLAMRGEA